MSTKTYIKAILGIFTLTLAIALAVLISDRLSTEALAVLAGAVCGVGAAIPTSLLIIAATQRTRQTETTPAPQQPQYTSPIVMMPPPMQIQPAAPAPPATWRDTPIRRHFTVVGGEMGQMGETERIEQK